MAQRTYITPAEFRAKPLGLPLKQYDDAQLQDYAEVATQQVEGFLERIISEDDYTETFTGDGSTTYLTRQYPLVSVTSLTEVSTGITYNTAANLVTTSDNTDAGRVQLDGLGAFLTFASGKTYTVVYRAGYAVLPPKVRQATALWMAELLFPDYSTQNNVNSSEQIVEMLTLLRRRRI